MQNICNLGCQNSFIFLISLIDTVQVQIKYRVDQHLIFVDLYSISINKFLVTEFMIVKVSENLNLMQKNASTIFTICNTS